MTGAPGKEEDKYYYVNGRRIEIRDVWAGASEELLGCGTRRAARGQSRHAALGNPTCL